MAPVLRTLTVSYSDDTIYALAVTLSFLHLAFHDYSYANTTASGHFQVSKNAKREEWSMLLRRLCCQFPTGTDILIRSLGAFLVGAVACLSRSGPTSASAVTSLVLARLEQHLHDRCGARLVLAVTFPLRHALHSRRPRPPP